MLCATSRGCISAKGSVRLTTISELAITVRTTRITNMGILSTINPETLPDINTGIQRGDAMVVSVMRGRDDAVVYRRGIDFGAARCCAPTPNRCKAHERRGGQAKKMYLECPSHRSASQHPELHHTRLRHPPPRSRLQPGARTNAASVRRGCRSRQSKCETCLSHKVSAFAELFGRDELLGHLDLLCLV
jgi:hypothetical protein